ncbi:MAG: DUF305 domain-containing protein [Vampirovibrionales bacterium]|nr:DUF305 domain-containing protein [Cyanobacteria bacterium HKST-UBA05]MCA9840549.1 DUF305 domain-containing protein [Cyanobacteria bacterium HKST-UBA03]
MSKYTKFFAMIGTSTAVMLGLMYLNTFSLEHTTWSETRFYMALIMGATMAIVMLTFMLDMYKHTKTNVLIYLASAAVFLGALFLVRSQTTVQDASWMSAMIPHHSIAILTSERAKIDDVRVRELADSIIKAQRKEIKEMKWLLDDINQHGEAKTKEDAAKRPVPKFEASL